MRNAEISVILNTHYGASMLDLRQLRALEAVAEHGSVVRAAEALRWSQPTVTHHLRGLEPDVIYRVVRDGAPIQRATGAELARAGLQVTLDAEWRSSVMEIEAEQ